MFQWLRKQVRPYTVNDLIEELVPGHRASMAREDQRRHEMDKQWHEQEVRMLKKARLEQELEDAEWILAYERRLTKLQTKTKEQRSRAEQLGANTDRLRRLEHHLSGLRRNLSLD
jgi:DNA/RNA-binding domain of Phe-tRNA-synthetase-like protein